MLRISAGIVPFWKRRFEKGSIKSLKNKEGRGIKPKLSEEKLSMLGSAIDEGVLMDDEYRRGFLTN